MQGLADDLVILRQPVLHKGPLHPLLFVALSRVDLLARHRVYPCIPHAGR